ncbi:HEXXH motif-containing putative peptide modification protein [Acrocarpospora sp. B8E8]|uniref:aKG-HExxH-type peptide beta-hydroxylase n=1 Tax=Acrocarpospora sp. B8E8 TaxID=3153572 RepID=UPI00325D4542
MTDGLVRHSLSAAELAIIGSGVLPGPLITSLKRAIASRNIALLEVIRRLSGPASPTGRMIGALWQELERRTDRGLAVLVSPQVGAWAEDTLRAEGRGDPVVLVAALGRRASGGFRLDTGEPLRSHFGFDIAETMTSARWVVLCREALQLLAARHGRTAASLTELITTIVPVNSPSPADAFSGTSGAAFGAVALSPPIGSAELAAAFNHELQHHVLAATQEIVALTEPDHPARFAVPWRDDPRNAAATLQGIYAHAAICEFHRAEWRDGPTADANANVAAYALWRQATAQVLTMLLDSGALTPAGRALAEAVGGRIFPLLTEAVPGWARQRAETELASRSVLSSSSVRYRG